MFFNVDLSEEFENEILIIISYALVPEEKVPSHQPKVALMDENNRIVEMIHAEPEKTVFL